MPNTILTPSIIAKEALMVLRNNAVMANLVHRDYSTEFVNGVGDTISIRKPAKFEAKEFAENVEIQDATETSVSVTMDKHLDVTFSVTAKQMALDIQSFSEQLLVPAMQAFADKIDKYLISLEADITNRVSHADGLFAPADIIAARKFLTDNADRMFEKCFYFVKVQKRRDTLQHLALLTLFISIHNTITKFDYFTGIFLFARI